MFITLDGRTFWQNRPWDKGSLAKSLKLLILIDEDIVDEVLTDRFVYKMAIDKDNKSKIFAVIYINRDELDDAIAHFEKFTYGDVFTYGGKFKRRFKKIK